MKKRLVTPVLIVALASLAAATSADAKGCRARCQRAIAACVARTCSEFHGRLKAGCKLGWRIELVGSCKHFPTANTCEDVAARNCAD